MSFIIICTLMGGTYLYVKGIISVGSIYVTISYSNKIGRGFQSFGEMFEYINTFAIAYTRLNELLNLTLEEKENNIKITNSKIVFKDASIIVNDKKYKKIHVVNGTIEEG